MGHLVVWGDFIAQSALWTRFVPASQSYAEALRKEGGVADWWELPKLGVKGNTERRRAPRFREERGARRASRGAT